MIHPMSNQSTPPKYMGSVSKKSGPGLRRIGRLAESTGVSSSYAFSAGLIEKKSESLS